MKIGIISDIHEDIHGLARALGMLWKKGCDEIICLGDIAGFSVLHYDFEKTRDASECLRLIRSKCSLILPGNHDLHACRKIPFSNPGFEYPPGWYDMDINRRRQLSSGKVWLYEDEDPGSNLTEDDKNFISNLPEYAIREIEGTRILFSHYLFPDLTGSSTSLLPDGSLVNSHLEFMESENCSLAFFGHSHAEGLWLIRKDKYEIKKRLRDPLKKGNAVIGVPCLAKGKNRPGISIYDTTKAIIKTYWLYPGTGRIFK